MRVRVNEKSISTKIDKALMEAEEELKVKLVDIAEDLTIRTPVDTGAYAESFSVVPSSSGGGRSRDSHGRPRRQDPTTYQNIALSNMASDIDRLEPIENSSISFRNRAPHAAKVEAKYQVFGATKDRNR